MRFARAVMFAAVLSAPGIAPAQESSWSLAQADSRLEGVSDVRETRWTSIRPPGGSYDRIELHRYRSGAPRAAVLLYLPGTNMNGEVALTDESHNLWLFLARRGVEVYALDYRTRFVPSAGVDDVAFMRHWGTQAFLDDVRAAAQQARRESGEGRLFVAGFSRGVFFAYALAGAEPEGVAGLVALDGYFKNHAPKGSYDLAAERARIEASAAWASDVSGRLGWQKRAALMDATAANPKGPSTDAKFPTIGAQLADILYNAWRPGGLANAVDGLSRPEVLARLLAGYDRYYPALQDVEGRSIADRDDDPATPIDDAWGETDVPVLYFGSTGMGADWLMNGIYSASRSGTPDVTLNVLESYGHLDVIVGENARREVFEPTLAWIAKRRPH